MSRALDVFLYHRQYAERHAAHDFTNVFGKITRDLSPHGLPGWRGMQVLDLGCGQRMPVSLLVAAGGGRATALDVNYVHPSKPLHAFYCAAQRNGLKRATWSLARQLLFDKRYYARLFAHSALDWRALDNVRFVCSDPWSAEYPLPNATYDVIVSNAVLEHVRDVRAYAREVRRLLKPNGLFHGIIHNYYSLSGGHNMRWAYPDTDPPDDVPPWDHLRDNAFPAHVYLNRLRPEDYRNAFAGELEVLDFSTVNAEHDTGGEEGRRFLTRELQRELAQYPLELLCARAWRIICRRRA